MKQVTVKTELAASVQSVWNALTDSDAMKEWYFDIPEFSPEPGFAFSFTGQGQKGEKYIHHCKITKVIPLKLLQHSWRYENHEGDSLVTFELTNGDEKVTLNLLHTGLNTFPQDNPDLRAESFLAGWTELLTKLLPAYLAGEAKH